MRVTCSLSGVVFLASGFEGIDAPSKESVHPIFNFPQKRLISYLGRWIRGDFNEEESYLYYLSLLSSTGLVKFRCPARHVPEVRGVIASNIEALCKLLPKLSALPGNALMPSVVLNEEAANLMHTPDWISTWNDALEDFKEGYRTYARHQELARKESALERMVRNVHKDPSEYAGRLAEWAADAGNFPTFSIPNPFTNSKNQISCSVYWQIIIKKCSQREGIFAVRRADLEELLSHCEDNIPVGSLFSHALFKILRSALERQKNFLGLGDMDIGRSTYEIINSQDSVESANMRAMVQAAPEQEPKESEYPTKLAFLQAKLRWNMAKKYGNQPI